MAGATGADNRELLERESALEGLGGTFGEVARGRAGRVVFIAGEAGIGKTAVVEAFCARVARARMFWGQCDPLATPAPLGPFVEIASGLGGGARTLIGRGARPSEVAQALLEDLSGERPALIVVEDLHWADEGTLDALAYLARRIQRAPALLIGTYRDDELDAAHPLRATLGLLATSSRVERIQLARLSRHAVGVLAGAVGQDAGTVFAVTRGNPFFVTELVAGPTGEVPGSVRDAVLARAAGLDGRARSLLDVIAVVPAQTELSLLERVSDGGLDGLGACLSAGMIEPHGQAVRFRHELARLALERELDPARARVLHRRVLAALEAAGAEPARLVHHAERAGDQAALLIHATVAGERSAALGAHREAAAHYSRAVSLSADRPAGERAELLGRCAFELYLTDRLEAAIEQQRQAVSLLHGEGDGVKEGDAMRLLSRFLWFGGHGGEAADVARQAVAVLEAAPEPSPELARAYSAIAQLRMLSNDNAEAITWGKRALELADRLGVPEVAVHALANIGTAEAQAGDERAGRGKIEESLRRARAAGLDDDVGRAYANLGALSALHRQTASADRYLTDGIAYCDEHDLYSYGTYLRAWRARQQLDSGQWLAAAELLDEVLAHPGASPPTRIVAYATGGLLAHRTGERARGQALLEQALELARATGELQRLGPVAAALAEAAWLDGRPGDVEKATAAALELAIARADPWMTGELIVWRRRAGLDAPAATVSPPFAAEARGDWTTAEMLWTDLGCPYDAALALAGSDEELPLRRALTELLRLGAEPAARIVARKLRRLGAIDIPRGPRRTTAANPAELTDRELEVLVLLSEGLRNADIAARLVVSPRTVEHHVSAIMSKLGVRTRGEASAVAVRLGLAARG